jgi:hypothetical protein
LHRKKTRTRRPRKIRGERRFNAADERFNVTTLPLQTPTIPTFPVAAKAQAQISTTTLIAALPAQTAAAAVAAGEIEYPFSIPTTI